METVNAQGKSRLSLADVDMDGVRTMCIRANYGHSVQSVTGIGMAQPPPKTLYHGTGSLALVSIALQGLLPMGRHAVHLTENKADALEVSTRKQGWSLLLRVSPGLHNRDVEWTKSADTWLVPHVPPACIDIDVGLAQMPACAGIILVYLVPRARYVATITTRRNEIGFPKGKRKKGEAVLCAALRELREETGIELSQLCALLPPRPSKGCLLLEHSTSGNPAVQFLVGVMRHVPDDNYGSCLPQIAAQDASEGISAAWVAMDELLHQPLIKNRRQLLIQANTLLNSTNFD